MGVLIVGLLSFLYAWFVAIPIIVLAIGLLAVRTGVLVDTQQRKYKIYREIFGITFGNWVSMDSIVSVTLILHSEETTIRGIMPTGPVMAGSGSVKSRTFNILISNGDKTTELNDFLEYKPACRAGKVIAQTLDIPFNNIVANKMAENRERRRNRG